MGIITTDFISKPTYADLVADIPVGSPQNRYYIENDDVIYRWSPPQARYVQDGVEQDNVLANWDASVDQVETTGTPNAATFFADKAIGDAVICIKSGSYDGIIGGAQTFNIGDRLVKRSDGLIRDPKGTLELSGVDENEFIANVGGIAQNSGLRLMSDGSIMSTKKFRVQNRTLSVGNSVDLFELGAGLAAISNVTDNKYQTAYYRYTEAGGTERGIILRSEPGRIERDVQVDDDTQQITNPNFQLIPQQNTLINEIKFKSHTAVDKVVMRITSNDTSKPIKFLPDEAAWDAVMTERAEPSKPAPAGTGYTLTIGDNIIDISDSPLAPLNAFNYDLQIEVMAVSDVVLLGNATIPYMQVYGNNIVVTEIPWRTDIHDSPANVGYPTGQNEFTIVSSLSAHDQFLFKSTYTDEISFSVDEEMPEFDFMIAYAGSGLSDEDAELVYLKVNTITQTPIGSDLLNPDYYRVDVNCQLWKGSAEKSNTLDPLAFGSIGEKVKLLALVYREVTAADRPFTLEQEEKLSHINNAPMVSEFFILDSGNNYMTTRYIKNVKDLQGSHSSGFNVNHAESRVTQARILLDRYDAPNLEQSDFDTLTLNDDSLSTGTFSFTQAQIDRLKQGEGEISVRISLLDAENNVVALRDAGNIDVLNSHMAFEIENTAFWNPNDYSEEADGKNRLSPFRLFGDVLVALSSLTGHKQIVSEGVTSLGDITNTALSGDVSNLIVDTKQCTYGNITLADHATTIECRHVDGSIQLGDQCEVIAKTIGSATAHTITFTSEVHDNTKIKAKRVESTTTLSFANLSATSKVIVEIDHYEGDTLTAVSTIPANVEVIGWIGDYRFGEIPFISDACILDSNGNKVDSIETIDELEDKTVTLYFNGQNSNMIATDATIIARRTGASENISTFTGFQDGPNSQDLTFTETDINNLRSGSGAIRLNILLGGVEYEGTCIDVKPKFESLNITASVNFLSDEDYNNLPNKTGSMPYSQINGKKIKATKSGTAAILNFEVMDEDIDVIVHIDGNVEFSISSGLTQYGGSTPSSGKIIHVFSIGSDIYFAEVASV